jgi:hypothetical protein
VTPTPATRGLTQNLQEKSAMKIFTITVRVTANRTITLAADSIAEAQEAAEELFDSLEEAEQIEKESYGCELAEATLSTIRASE